MIDTHTTPHIPDEAVQAALDATNGNIPPVLLEKALHAALPHLSAPRAVEVPTKEERHANTSRNLIINQTSTDLEQIINGHDPEQSILNNDVWDRLDKMACEIEALTKPVDVAAVRKQAFDDACNVIDGYDEYDRPYCCSGHMCGCYGATVHQQMKHYIRSLSAEPAQGDQWQPIETAPKDGGEFLARCSADKPSFSCFWDGSAFMHYEHGEGLISYSPTEWMPLPALTAWLIWSLAA